MTSRVKIAIGLTATVFSGLGVYGLLRMNRSLASDSTEGKYLPMEYGEDPNAENSDPTEKEDGLNADSRAKTNSSEDASKSSAETDSGKKQPNIGAEKSISEESNDSNPTDAQENRGKDAVEEGTERPDSTANVSPKQSDKTKTTIEVGDNGNGGQGQSSKGGTGVDPRKDRKTSKNSAKGAKGQTYREYINSLDANKGKNILWVGEGATKYELKNIMLQRMFPQYRDSFVWPKDVMFEGSPEIHFRGETHTKNGKNLYILKRNTDEEAEALKKACIEALNREKPADEGGKVDRQVRKLRFWCSVPTIEDVLQRHKFKIPETDDE